MHSVEGDLKARIIEELASIRPVYDTSLFVLASTCAGTASFDDAVQKVIELARSGDLLLCCPLDGPVDLMTPVIPRVLKVGEATPAMARLLYGEPERTWREGDHEHLLYNVPGRAAATLLHRITFDADHRLVSEKLEERQLGFPDGLTPRAG